MDKKIETMAKALRDPSVALMKYNKLRGRQANGLVFAFEGHDDPIFYHTVAQRCNFKEPFHVLVVDGKDMVLGLRNLLSNSDEAEKGGGVVFFVDADFDGLKGHAPGGDLYITPTYSIENFLVDSSTLKSFLNFEFKLYEDELEQDLDPILNLYSSVLEKFHEKIRHTNQVIFFGRTKSIEVCNCKIKSIEESSERFFKFNKSTFEIENECEGEKIKEVVRFDADFNLDLINSINSDFEKLVPIRQWRGKFHFSFFKQFLSALVEDRNSEKPKYFTKGKGKVKLNLSTDSAFRLLSTACEVPTCLSAFFANLPNSALH